ncbi:hypothetical protein COE25_24575 [Bacillus sp. AFS031507]|nr:hypothetical protein COE25_24575 [Bacillus sp. AFS031507]
MSGKNVASGERQGGALILAAWGKTKKDALFSANFFHFALINVLFEIPVISSTCFFEHDLTLPICVRFCLLVKEGKKIDRISDPTS